MYKCLILTRKEKVWGKIWLFPISNNIVVLVVERGGNLDSEWMAILEQSVEYNILLHMSVENKKQSFLIVHESESLSVLSDSLWPQGLYSSWNSPGQNTGVGSLSLPQGIFPTQGSNPGLPHCRWILHQLSYKGSPRILEWLANPFSSGFSWLRNRIGVSFISGRFFTNREAPTVHVQFSSVTHLYPTLCDPMNCSMPGFPVHHQLQEFTQSHVHWVGDAIQPTHPLSSPSPPAFNIPSIRVFSSELVLHIRWPKYWSFSFSISPSNEYSGLTSFRMDWLDLLAVQGTRKSLLRHHSSKASVLQLSAFLVHEGNTNRERPPLESDCLYSNLRLTN